MDNHLPYNDSLEFKQLITTLIDSDTEYDGITGVCSDDILVSSCCFSPFMKYQLGYNAALVATGDGWNRCYEYLVYNDCTPTQAIVIINYIEKSCCVTHYVSDNVLITREDDRFILYKKSTSMLWWQKVILIILISVILLIAPFFSLHIFPDN